MNPMMPDDSKVPREEHDTGTTGRGVPLVDLHQRTGNSTTTTITDWYRAAAGCNLGVAIELDRAGGDYSNCGRAPSVDPDQRPSASNRRNGQHNTRCRRGRVQVETAVRVGQHLLSIRDKKYPWSRGTGDSIAPAFIRLQRATARLPPATGSRPATCRMPAPAPSAGSSRWRSRPRPTSGRTSPWSGCATASAGRTWVAQVASACSAPIRLRTPFSGFSAFAAIKSKGGANGGKGLHLRGQHDFDG